MKKRKLYLALTASILTLATPVHAWVSQNTEVSTTGEKSSVSVNSQVYGSNTTTYSSSSDNSVSISQSGGDNNEVIINNNNFKVSGIITAYSQNSISVSNQKISIDKSKVSNFSQSGNLSVGNKVTVEGKIISGTLFAEKITATGTTTSTPKPSEASSNQISININSNSTVSASPSATIAVDVNSQNAIQQLINSLQNLINQLKTIFKL